MNEPADQRLLLASAREDFLAGGRLPKPEVPDHVAASWQRSAARGVQPQDVATIRGTDLDWDSRLSHCARPVIQHLCEKVADLPLSVALTDELGRILSRHDSNPRIGRMLDRVQFAPGFDYAEGSVGTNGVGTALEFGDAIHIVGAEHFVETLQTFACAAATIRNPFTNRIEGVLDISCLSEHSTSLMQSLVRSAAREVENNLLLDRRRAQRVLFDAYAQADARSRQPVLAVGEQVTMANSSLQALIEAKDQQALQDQVRFLSSKQSIVDERVELPSGADVRIRGMRVEEDAETLGMVAVVTRAPRVEESGQATHGDLRAAPHPSCGAGPAAFVSSSQAWHEAAMTVDAALRAGRAALVLGETGSGRFTLLSEASGRIAPRTRVVSIDTDDIGPSLVDAPEALFHLNRDHVLHVIRDLDRLCVDSAHALATVLRENPSVKVAATAVDGIAAHTSHQHLLAHFDDSATVPALQYRIADLPALVASMLAALAPQREVRVSPEVLSLLKRSRWPGNLRQLREVLSAALARRPVGTIKAHDLPASCQSAPPGGTLRRVDQSERDAIVAALRETQGNRMAAAAELGIARSTLYRKIRQYGITS